MTRQEREARERCTREYAEMAREFEAAAIPTDLKEQARYARIDRELEQARALRRKLESIVGRLPNRNRQPMEMPPVGDEPKWVPYSDGPDWYTPQEVEQYSWEGSLRDGTVRGGLMSMRASHSKGHPEMPNRGNRAVVGCRACCDTVYRRKRRIEMNQDVAAWLGGNCCLCLKRKTPMEYRLVRRWGGKSNLGHRLYHAAGDIQPDAVNDYALMCHPCYKDGGRMKLFEKMRKHTAFADPPPRQGRHPKGTCTHPGCKRDECRKAQRAHP